MSIEKEILDTIGTKPMKKGGDRQKFLFGVVEQIDALDQDDWNRLSDQAKAWFNGATEAVKSKEDIEDFPEETEEAESSDDRSERSSGKTKEKAVKTAARKKPAPEKEVSAAKKGNGKVQAAKPAPTRRASGGGGSGAPDVIRDLVISNPAISTQDLVDKLEKKDLHPTRFTVASIKSTTLSIIRKLSDAGYLNKNMKL